MIVVVLTLNGTPVAAQSASAFPPPPAPGLARPIPEPGPTPQFQFSIPAPRRSPVPRAVDVLTFKVRDIKINGATVYSKAELRPLIEPVIGKTVHLSDIIGIADAIEAKYRANGYVLTRAYVPPQRVSNGVFQIDVVEGYIDAVSVEGGNADERAEVDKSMAPVLASRPLKLAVIQSALLRANDMPGISASGLIRPSPVKPGASDLVVTLAAAGTVAGDMLSIDNRGSESTGRWTIEADTAIRSPLGDNGEIFLVGTIDPDVSDLHRRYSILGKYVEPLGLRGATTSFAIQYAHGQPGGAVATLGLITNTLTAGPRINYPLIVSRENKLAIDGGFTVESSDIAALGQPFSHDEWRVADVAVTYQQTGFLDGVSSLSLDVAKGLEIFGASKPGSSNLSRSGGRPDFVKLSTILRRTQQVYGALNLAVLGIGQYAFSPLLLGEQISYGGAQVGRGYDPASLTGDSGMGGDIELRYDFHVERWHLDLIQPYLFYDVAAVWSKLGSIQENRLESAGFGVRTVVAKTMSVGLEGAHAFIPLPTNENGARDWRVFVNAAVRF
ncbi:MAG: ShlB/FhaC/HecB family hemolysin secretion/activation protein [Alphaproteobacteria bacterium]|nr:ShlB/FhaC/HecB family hemolysin secretion/activation protein [Alphaproteobacteria bacterium]